MPSTSYVLDNILGTWHTKVNKTGQKILPSFDYSGRKWAGQPISFKNYLFRR